MKKLRYKTNINCGGCIATVKPFLDQANEVKWSVDTANPEKILTVEGENIDSEKIEKLVREAGFNISPKKDFLGGLFS